MGKKLKKKGQKEGGMIWGDEGRRIRAKAEERRMQKKQRRYR